MRWGTQVTPQARPVGAPSLHPAPVPVMVRAHETRVFHGMRPAAREFVDVINVEKPCRAADLPGFHVLELALTLIANPNLSANGLGNVA